MTRCTICGIKTSNELCRDCRLHPKKVKASELVLEGGYWYNDHGIQRWKINPST